MPTIERPGGITLNYAASGDPEAPAVILLHDSATDLRMWAPHIGPFSRDYRVITPDLRGHGASSTPPFEPFAEGQPNHYAIEEFSSDLVALLDELEIPLCALAGTGFGGMVALQFATSWPGRVAGLVLSDTSAAPDDPAYDAICRAHEAQCLQAAALVERFGTSELGKRACADVADPFLAAGIRNRYARLSRDGFLGAAYASRSRPGLLALLGERLTMPVLVCIGSADPLRSAAEAMAAQLPDARVSMFDDVGHGVPVLRPEAFGKAVFAFFREVEDSHQP